MQDEAMGPARPDVVASRERVLSARALLTCWPRRWRAGPSTVGAVAENERGATDPGLVIFPTAYPQ